LKEELKNNLVTDKYIYTFNNPLKIEITTESKDNITLKNDILNIFTDSIYSFALAFEAIYQELKDKHNFTEDQLKQKKYLDLLGITCEKKQKASKRVNSKQKGSRGEREVVELLKESYFPSLRIFRTPGSGSLATIHNFKPVSGTDLSSDLFAEDDGSEAFKIFNSYCFEVKSYNSLPDFLGINYKRSEPLIEWVNETETNCSRNNKKFCIIFKSNRSPHYIMFKETDISTKPFKDNWLLIFKLNNTKYCVYLLDNQIIF
jgi:hypothetical protein